MYPADRLAVAETACGVVGVNICADYFPDSLDLGHSLARMGAQILLSPSAWAVPAEHDPIAEPPAWPRCSAAMASLIHWFSLLRLSPVGGNLISCPLWLPGNTFGSWKYVGVVDRQAVDGESGDRLPDRSPPALSLAKLFLWPTATWGFIWLHTIFGRKSLPAPAALGSKDPIFLPAQRDSKTC